MSFKEDIKVKDYFMKDYSKQDVLNTFNIMIEKIAKTGEIEGDLQNAKITRN